MLENLKLHNSSKFSNKTHNKRTFNSNCKCREKSVSIKFQTDKCKNNFSVFMFPFIEQFNFKPAKSIGMRVAI